MQNLRMARRALRITSLLLGVLHASDGYCIQVFGRGNAFYKILHVHVILDLAGYVVVLQQLTGHIKVGRSGPAFSDTVNKFLGQLSMQGGQDVICCTIYLSPPTNLKSPTSPVDTRIHTTRSTHFPVA